MNLIDNWISYFIGQAEYCSQKSKDPSTQVGCVLIGEDNTPVSTGFNGFARGINENDPARWERPTKYDYVVHAEHNAILNAARLGHKTKGSILYINWGGAPCGGCANAIIQAGVKAVISNAEKPFVGKGNGTAYSTDFGAKLLLEAGVSCLEANKSDGDVVSIYAKDGWWRFPIPMKSKEALAAYDMSFEKLYSLIWNYQYRFSHLTPGMIYSSVSQNKDVK